MKSIKYLLLFAALLFASCAKKTEYKNPEIGMQYSELTDFCKALPSHTQSKQDKNISILIVKYSENGLTPKSECSGTFTFENGKLAKIE